MTTRRAPIEVLEALAEAAIRLDHLLSTTGHFGAAERHALNEASAAYRAATAPLRTLAEVDAEIAQRVRKLHEHCDPEECSEPDLYRLCSEPTRDEPEPDIRKCLSCGRTFGYGGSCKKCQEFEPNATTDHDADLREPERCGCEEAEALKAKLANIRTEWGLWRADKKNGYAALVSIGTLLRNE